MIRICRIGNDHEPLFGSSLEDVKDNNIQWHWADFYNPDEQEMKMLTDFYHFHPLAIEDCMDNFNQRPKMDFYEDYQFLVIHSLEQKELSAVELDMFVGENFIVTFHKEPVPELEATWKSMQDSKSLKRGPFFLMHSLIDKTVDEYFPPVYKMETELNEIEDNTKNDTVSELMDQLFDLRADLSKLRKTILPMRDMLYRMTHSERLSYLKEQHLYFNDVHDHLLKLAEMLESYRDFSSDIRDSYLSLNSNNMNTTMMTLTVITTIFMPLTFIAGVYGMNFKNMPELDWHYGYYLVWAVMLGIALCMFLYFVKRGWLGSGRRKRKKGLNRR
ncbi:magnesium transporter [Bacillus sp. OV322]|uniref:magnesium/cobalt transporter CorA n=1 Tax=Bacillus sp. OV322 TaxID=1882764 RepID=UPI0008E640CF|nr:magnesium/cobalt transporter CorA [Bacillus sp. OV322]SFC03108.1 magnesium transporter [Bacillus sp. OV322]